MLASATRLHAESTVAIYSSASPRVGLTNAAVAKDVLIPFHRTMRRIAKN
jgi:hypothetical protein